MSVYYRDKNGARRVVAGMTPGGDLEMGAVAIKHATASLPITSPDGQGSVAVTFTDGDMPDTDYLVDIKCTTTMFNFYISNKTISGFTLTYRNVGGSPTAAAHTATLTAFKLYTVSEAEQNASDITTIKSYIPATTSSSNKLVNQSDLSDVEIDKLEDINDVDLTNVQNGQTILWDDTNSKWVNGPAGKTYTAGPGIAIVNGNRIDAKINDSQLNFDQNGYMIINPTYKTTFVGTTAEWEALSSGQKALYTLVNLTDDKEALGIDAVDAVTNGDMRPVTSNAVYDALNIETFTYATMNSGMENGQFTGIKINNLVIITGSFWNTTHLNDGSVFTIPNKYKPLNLVKGNGAVEQASSGAVHTSGLWYLTTTGTIGQNFTTTANLKGGSFTFIYTI